MRTKENYGGLDCFRLAAALLVIAIHTSPLASVSTDADFFLTRILARIAVPFFLMVSGQFAAAGFLRNRDCADNGGASVSALLRCLRKTLLLYLAGILLYLPIGIYAGHYRDLTLGAALRMLVFDGTFYHLWYFPACITGMLLVYLMSRRLRLRGMLVLSAALYLIGLFGDSYFGLAQLLPPLKNAYEAAFHIFSYTRNGLFLAPLFLVLGAWISKGGFLKRYREDPRRYAALNLMGLAVSFLLMTGEAFCLRHFVLQRHDSMYLMLVPVMLFLYQSLLCLRARPRRLLRSAALWIYMLHPALIVAVRGIAKPLKMTSLLVDNSIIHYLAVTALSLAAGFGMAFLQNRIALCRGRHPQPEKSINARQSGRVLQPNPTGRAWIRLDRESLAANVSLLRSLLPEGCRLMPAVKADAYGHGAVLIAGELNRLGIDAFCVASVAEGITLRRAGIQGEILILGYTPPEDFPLLVHFQLTQTVIDYPYARLLARSGLKLHVHVGIDTGMHRLGIRCEQIEDIAAVFAMKNLVIDGMFTHLGASDSPDPESRAFTKAQIDAFYQVADILEAQGLPQPRLHLQATYGLLNYPCLDADYVRAGIALYGVHSRPENAAASQYPLSPVLSLMARVASVRTLYPGDSAGYGMDFTADKETLIAVLSIGYADGLPRELSGGKGHVLIHGSQAPIIGRVCMDMTLVDISAGPQTQAGDIAVLIGRSGELEITAEEIASQCGTIANELLSRLGARLERIMA